MYIVTGGAGFIGSNIVRGLNARGIDHVVVVDELTDGRKYENLVGLRIADYWDKDLFADRLRNGDLGEVEAVFHQGACSTTTEWDGRYMMEVNYRYSTDLFEYCLESGVPLIYASSAAVYGASTAFRENEPDLEKPLNVYGYSKLLFDQYVRRRLPETRSQVVGLRYFNVYGPGEAFKGQMASVAFHMHGQLEASGEVRLFVGSDGYGDGEQRRDFVYVDDVVDVNLWFMDHPNVSGVFNVGTGDSATFNDIANAVIDWHGKGRIRYIEFPDGLRARYQSFTQADISMLREAGYDGVFRGVADGVKSYLDVIGRSQ